MNNNIWMWRQDSWNVCLYFPLVAKEFATDKDKTMKITNIEEQNINTVNVKEASMCSCIAYFP